MRKARPLVVSTGVAVAALLGSILGGAGGCGRSVNHPTSLQAESDPGTIEALRRDNEALVQRIEGFEKQRPVETTADAAALAALKRDNAELRLRVAALEQSGASTSLGSQHFAPAPDTAEELGAENARLRVRIGAASAAKAPPPLVLPTAPARSTRPGTNHFSHSSHASHSSHSSHRSSR